ncbi:MAG: AAA family ATPase [Deltaproteobacteria bacterium]|nr:AAA family ATPase [Deltaproteobacteria bacterium]
MKGDYVYADKTKYVYDLAQQEGAFFLSRPKSLSLRTGHFRCALNRTFSLCS